MILVVDTNVWISALRFGGTVAQVLEKAVELGEVVTSPMILEEVSRVFAEKFRVDTGTVLRVVEQIRTYAREVHPTDPAPEVCRDPNDNHVLHLCRFVAADILLTGDKDLLVLKQFEQTRILRPAQFAELLQG
ncbi:MAG: putative toxin-antitoxin system toxin component, PIN family [Bacteroidia bacterium]|nr:putative toxin-antitoxin system toxin component, PIN family [Bacteroidia bacterium]